MSRVSRKAVGDLNRQVASRVRARRLALGLSQSDVCGAIGCTYQQIQKYERGRNRITVDLLWRFASVLGLDVADLIDGYDGGAIAPIGKLHGSRRALNVATLLHELSDRDLETVGCLVRSLARASAQERAVCAKEPDRAA